MTLIASGHGRLCQLSMQNRMTQVCTQGSSEGIQSLRPSVRLVACVWTLLAMKVSASSYQRSIHHRFASQAHVAHVALRSMDPLHRKRRSSHQGSEGTLGRDLSGSDGLSRLPA